jgi:prolyl-tRNA synthetase
MEYDMQKLPNITTNFSDWYNEVIYQAELVDQTPVRGAVVIRPYGWAIWEEIRGLLDKRIKETGHQNASFPLLIPESFLKKEAEHVEGFAPELAVVTHAGGKKLEEPLVIRPTSETMIHYMFARWIKSWRDLPLKINQWANVMRWELRPRPFLRTTEFFWQEGHTAHATKQEAHDEVHMMLQEYVNLAENYLAIPVVTGRKSETEKFPGAEETHTFEALMPDGKALQMGTSHLLSQSFAKAFDMKYQDKEEKIAYPYLTSWGATTRLIGAMVMTHGDQKGLIIPPNIAPIQVVIIPILKKGADNSAVTQKAQELSQALRRDGFRVELDTDESKTPGAKFYYWELRGVPMRIEIGPRDLDQGHVILADRLGMTKEAIPFDALSSSVKALSEKVQNELFERAVTRRKEQWHTSAKLFDFAQDLETKGGFYQTGWCGKDSCENELKKYKATTRCVLEQKSFDECFNCTSPSAHDVLVARSY